MKNTQRILLVLFFGMGVLFSEISDGGDIEVELGTTPNNGLVFQKKVQKEGEGFYSLDLTLTNSKSEPVILHALKISIPLHEEFQQGMEILYGGDSLERSPIQRMAYNEESENARSAMFAMIRVDPLKYLFAGALTWKIFAPIFTFRESSFVVSSSASPKTVKPGESVHYEKIVWGAFPDWKESLDLYRDALVRENKIKKSSPVEFRGWGTWDYFGRRFNSNQIERNMEVLNENTSSSNLILIDEGWIGKRGDFLSVREDLEGGVKGIADKIHKNKKTAGLLIDLFRGEVDSEVCQKHPDYFLHDGEGNLVVNPQDKSGKKITFTYFDYSNPAAIDYMVKAMESIKSDWGIRYFKLDLMRFGLESEIRTVVPAVKRFKAYDMTLSDLERYGIAMKALRRALGEDCYLLGTGAIYGPCIGFVDGMRTSAEVSPLYGKIKEKAMANLGSYYLNRKVFDAECGYLVFREAADEEENVSKESYKSGGALSFNEAEMWGNLNILFGNSRMSGDNLPTLRLERLLLLSHTMKQPVMDEAIPLDLWGHAARKEDPFEVILAHQGDQVYIGLFNWSDQPNTYHLRCADKGASFSTLNEEALPAKIELKGRHSIVVKYQGSENFTSLKKTLIW